MSENCSRADAPRDDRHRGVKQRRWRMPRPRGDDGKSRSGHFILFLRCYLLVMAAYVLILFAGVSIWVLVTSQKDRSIEEAKMRGTHYLIEQRYLRVPSENWPALTQELRSHFAYPLRLVEIEALRSELNEMEWQRLLRGELLMESENDAHTFQRLPGTKLAVALGSFESVTVDEVSPADWYLIETIIMFSILFMAVALPLYFLVYRLWRDLHMLRETADGLSAGGFSLRAPVVATRLVNPLGRALNQMAGQIQQLLENQRILAQAVAHEIRTPLARMRFGLDALETADGTSERAVLLDGLDGDIRRLEYVAAQSVTYARIGRMANIERRPIVVAYLLDDLAHLFEFELSTRLSFDRSAVETISANREALELALRNLIANGLRHARSRVLVSVIEENGWHVLRVEDDGEGVPVTERGRLFQPFTQLHKHIEGFGLGLALVRVVAEKHGGSAAIVDSPLGGACFRIELPAR